MVIALAGTFAFVLAAALALVAFPIPPRGEASDRQFAAPRLHGPDPLLTSISARISREYHAGSGSAKPGRMFWNNLQILRIISAIAIVYIHMAPVLTAIHLGPEFVEVLRCGTDLFLVVAGFLTAHVLADSRKSGAMYLRNRLIRLVPLYAIFTVLAFAVQDFVMSHHHFTVMQLFMSLSLMAYGPFPVLYPAWALIVIVQFSVIVAVSHTISVERGIYYACVAVIFLVVIGQVGNFDAPAIDFYTNPILIDFTLGVLVYKVATGRTLAKASPKSAIHWAVATVGICAVVIVVRSYFWPDLPRLLGLGVPMACVVLAMAVLERAGVCRNRPLVDFLAKCTYGMYLSHYFVSVVAHKLVELGGDSYAIALILLVVVPVIVVYVGMAAYLYLESPITRYLLDRVPDARTLAALPIAWRTHRTSGPA